MEKNKKIIKPKSAKKNIEKNNKIANIKIKDNKKDRFINNLIKKTNHSTNNNSIKKIKNIARKINKNPNIYSSFSNSVKISKTNFEKEYNKLENLCSKKTARNKKEIKNYISEQKMKYKKEEEKKKITFYKTYEKMFQNYKNLEKKIKQINIVKNLEIEENKEIPKENNLHDKSNGSIENNKFNKKYYFGCIDVKRILSKHIIINNDNKNKKYKNNNNKK